ncbi:hypothetical protein JOF53_007386 [Crossiella equi]|uniref:Cardiolipin synthase N-terminal domain-containing protein n=1 Tax=Crossiella equi TaxID=130796 RepID=A0ABS5APL9_9PSEU|nr:PLD nuclease N-terminal domain-containing protein [Crossiella equi]MBP2478514.1 hypothetical protein [Crossiella equi]
MTHQRWSDLTRPQRLGLVVAATLQLGLAAAAWSDLHRRPAEAVRGPKRRWALLIGVNFVGPLAYFAFGRERSGTTHRRS